MGHRAAPGIRSSSAASDVYKRQGMALMPVRFCVCLAFVLWYGEAGVRVCRCGHPDREHIDGTATCVGDVEVDGPRA